VHSEICPICWGKGYIENYYGTRKRCHGCSGKGWILVPDHHFIWDDYGEFRIGPSFR